MKSPLQAAMDRAGRTHAQVLREATPHVKRPVYSLYVSGKALPPSGDALAYALLLGVSPRDLFPDAFNYPEIQALYHRSRPGTSKPKRKAGNPELRARVPAHIAQAFIKDIRALGFEDFGAYIRDFAIPTARYYRMKKEAVEKNGATHFL